ncbi:hypothetical protein NDU88_007012 [Pleurodeles waltl]|uniref:Uncharacterized protein n=1 Tax=Pleurodeles waltl TaxID=8319 RepID=A0AAV7VRA3_PLEWA|nr:hypothetical protein NDU88_007012 [Pleurodeles waltl]
MDNDLDRSGRRNGQSSAFYPAGLQWLRDCGLTDTWREVNPNTQDYTFYSVATKTYTRIDYFLASPAFQAHIRNTTIEPRSVAGHVPLSLLAQFDLIHFRSPNWIFRDSILQSHSSVEDLRRSINDYLSINDNESSSLTSIWDALKAGVRGEVISISDAENKARREQQLQLEQKVAE